MAAALAVVIGAVTLARHWLYLTAAYDMGFYVHDVWQIAHGNWTNSVFGFHVFADHLSPLMILLAPLAWVATAEGLLIVQALAVASTVIPAYRLGSHLGGDRLGWLAAIWVGLSANVWHTFMYDFRPATLGYVALIWLIAEMETERRRWLIYALCALSAMAREDVAVMAGIAVLIQAGIERSRRLAWPGVLTAGVGLWYSLVGQRLFAPFEYFMWYRYADYGDTPGQVLDSLDYAIPTALARLGRAEVLVAVAALLLPYLVLPALTQLKRTWPAFVIILSNGVSADPFIPTIYYQYYLLCVAFLAWGAVHAYRKAYWASRMRVSAIVTVSVFLAFGPVMSFGATPYGRSIADVIQAGDRRQLDAEIPALSPDASVSAGNIVLPHLAERANVFSFPLPITCSDVILRHTDSTHFPEWVIVEASEPALHEVDLEALGYDPVDTEGHIQVWTSSGEHPEPRPCPSPETARQNFFDRLATGS